VPKVLTEPARLVLALHAAAYIRWVETRKGKSPQSSDVHLYIRGLLDEKGFSYDPDEPLMIDLLALSLDIDAVHDFAAKNGIFEKLDRLTTRRTT
jgi:hypothetical protein